MNTSTSSPERFAGLKTYTPAKVSEILNVPLSGVYELIRSNAFPHKRLSPRRIRIPCQPFEEWLARSDDWESYNA